MAITNAQQYQQLVNPPMKGKKRPGYRGDAAYGDKNEKGQVKDSFAAGDGFDRDSFKDAVRRGELRNITNRIEQEKIEEKLEPFRRLGSNQRKFQNFVKKFSPVAMFASKFGPLNTRDFFTDNVLGSKNFANITKEQFANLTNEEQEELFDNYMDARMSGKTDAYGNPINRGDGEGSNLLIPQGIMAQAPSIMDQEPEEDEGLRLAFRADGGPIGGEYDFDSARQMYGLGKLVKKVTRTVKKIAKSPIGKAAIIGAVGFGIPGVQSGFFSKGLMGTKFGLAAKNFAANKILGPAMDYGRGTGGILDFLTTGKGITTAIAGASALAGLLTSEQEEEAQELSRGEGIDIEAARRMILQAGTSADQRALAFKADGGRIEYQEGSKEPVAKKTMPLLDMGGKEMDLREDGGFVPIGRMEKADDVPARLSKNEFVFTADAVRNAGDGDVDKGAEVMYNMMKNLEAGGDVSEESQGLEGARKMFQTSQRLEEVL